MKISQRQARAMRRRVNELEKLENYRLYAWTRDWPNGVRLGEVSLGTGLAAACRTARKLKHAVVLTCVGDDKVELHALPVAS